MRLTTFLPPVLSWLVLQSALVAGHARIRYPPPFDAPPETPAGNAYNAPLKADGSEFPCKGLHKSAATTATPTEWTAGSSTYFEILGNSVPSGGEGALAAHSGGSCQASLSFDGGTTWKVLHSYIGGCPRGVKLGSNIATDPNQKFPFLVPQETKSGKAIFAWTWVAVSGNRNEFYMNCAPVDISGSGTSTLDSFPDMFLGEMQIAGGPGPGQCASTAMTALDYPNPGPNSCVTRDEVTGIPFKAPTPGNCHAPGSKGEGGGAGGSGGDGSAGGAGGGAGGPSGSTPAPSTSGSAPPPPVPSTGGGGSGSGDNGGSGGSGGNGGGGGGAGSGGASGGLNPSLKVTINGNQCSCQCSMPPKRRRG